MRFSGIKHRFRPWFMVWIVVMWCMLMGEVTVANLVGGLLVSLFIVFALPLPAMPVAGISVSWGKLIVFMAQWFVELLEASIMVGWLAVRPQPVPKTAIVKLPMRVENEFILSLAVSLYNLQPGGTVSDIDIANRMLTIHLLNADSEKDLEREIAAVRKLEADMIAIFERSHP
ncbi:cation:proton antiporter [Corynebacterium sp. HMSC035E02]|uniref:Na+/H+ antiporter subunit E n=1 Tax=unclassified Corynebacterium TaxID=2624378 RepID=UPI0008A9D1C7|nr:MULTISPECIES: Na+/H+ antiporter subunit E [unclassified Corynebacterium]OFQ57535.1 cation:proton antiporter [Corynebacterium sp. HMSC074H12]OHO55893.1 cation:proton antiporter [Corynebacterium sp. HMSC035E02]